MIHPKAIIDEEAVLGEDVQVGAYAVIEKGVRLGSGVTVSPFACLKGNTHIGDNTFVGVGAIIGEVSQALHVRESPGEVYIGRNNIIREYVIIYSSVIPGKATSLGDNNSLMAFSHIAHDCKLADNIVVCSGVLLAGYVDVQDGAFISGNVVIHQFVRIGRLAMIGSLSRVNQDVLPFVVVIGDSCVWGVNLPCLKKAGFSREDISGIKKAHNFIYRRKLTLKNALAKLEKIESNKVKEIIIFILSSKRGICGPKKNTLFEKLFLNYPYFLRTKIPTYRLFLKSRPQKLKIKEKDLDIS